MNSPKVVAIGGGHGLAMTLRAVRRYTDDITAIVSVADDGGSTGRLRRDLGVLGVGDLRKCLVALADADDTDASSWAEAWEHRFAAGDLEGHALGNLILVGLADVSGDWEIALAVAGRTLGAVGRVLPATNEPVVLKAELDHGCIEGQVKIQNSTERIRRVALVPPDAASPAAVTESILAADQIVLAPGSLFTSLLPALCVSAVTSALTLATGPVVQVVNLAAQLPETEGLDAKDHLQAVLDHGLRVDDLVIDARTQLVADDGAIERLGVRVVRADLARPDVAAHEPAKLAPVLAGLLESASRPEGHNIRIGQRRPKMEES